MTDLFSRKFVVLTGNYGSGKTELALNLALASCPLGPTTLVDLDIVNPYFRSGEKADALRDAGVRVLMPTFAMSTVDVPALPPEIQSVFEAPADRVIFDVGGDDTGAAALGRYAPSFRRLRGETLVCLAVNCMRPLTQRAEDIAEMGQRIMQRGRLSIDLLINNTNLADQTEPDMLRAGHRETARAAAMLGVERVMTAGTAALLAKCPELPEPLVIRRHMAPEWMEDV